ncbi:hypothetical protein LY78DRAFT_121275 [Colletotrichum sublineola]|nr:hypothetical protein LY78DRAFT_121275 [Colletotrichum sublineola]
MYINEYSLVFTASTSSQGHKEVTALPATADSTWNGMHHSSNHRPASPQALMSHVQYQQHRTPISRCLASKRCQDIYMLPNLAPCFLPRLKHLCQSFPCMVARYMPYHLTWKTKRYNSRSKLFSTLLSSSLYGRMYEVCLMRTTTMPFSSRSPFKTDLL